MSFHTFSFLEQAVQQWPERVAIIESNRSTTFTELYESSLKLSALLGKFELPKKGIGFVCGNSSKFVSGLLACSRTGAVIMPILPGTREAEMEKLFMESGIRFLLSEKTSRYNFSSVFNHFQVGDEFDLYEFSNIQPSPVGEIFQDAAFIRPSSGTTGTSKGVVISHRAVMERTAAANEGLHLDHTCTMLWVLPMAFHFVVSVLLYIRYGVSMIISDNFTAEAIIDRANKFKATHLYASPLHYRLLASGAAHLKFETLKKAISTSALLEPAVSKSFFEKYGLAASQAYGIIEIGLPFINEEGGIEKSDSIGKALPAYRAAILDEDHMEISSGQGAFAIQGPGMFSGYLWPLKYKQEVLVRDWFLTGDVAEMDAEGFVYIKGRSKSMINVSGNKVFPEEVEAVLTMHAAVKDARVFGGRHQVTGEIVEAEVVLRKAFQADAEEIISFCRKQLAPYKIPQRIHFVEEIKKTHTGKTTRT